MTVWTEERKQSMAAQSKARWAKMKAEGWVHKSKRKENGGVEVWDPNNARPMFPVDQPLHDKLDAILDVLTKLFPIMATKDTKEIAITTKATTNDLPLPPTTVESHSVFLSLSPLRERIKNLRGDSFKGKSRSAEEVFKRVGAKTVENAVMENRQFWDGLNLSLVNSTMSDEGFAKGDDGKFIVGPA